MPKKKTSKSATKKAKAPAKKSASGTAPVAVAGSVGFRLRMSPANHKQLLKLAAQNGVSQNTMLNQLIRDTK